jgi:hypothetical protein
MEREDLCSQEPEPELYESNKHPTIPFVQHWLLYYCHAYV